MSTEKMTESLCARRDDWSAVREGNIDSEPKDYATLVCFKATVITLAREFC